MGAGEQMNRLIHVGFGNIVNTDKIIAIVGDIFYPAQKAVHERYQEITRNYSRGNIEYGKDLREKVGK